jgi:hypothetical protein
LELINIETYMYPSSVDRQIYLFRFTLLSPPISGIRNAVLLRAADERREASEAEARQHNAKEDAEYLQLLAEDQRRALEAQRRAEEEAAAARREEEHRQVQEGQVPSLGDAAMAPPRQVALGNA